MNEWGKLFKELACALPIFCTTAPFVISTNNILKKLSNFCFFLLLSTSAIERAKRRLISSNNVTANHRKAIWNCWVSSEEFASNVSDNWLRTFGPFANDECNWWTYRMTDYNAIHLIIVTLRWSKMAKGRGSHKEKAVTESLSLNLHGREETANTSDTKTTGDYCDCHILKLMLSGLFNRWRKYLFFIHKVSPTSGRWRFHLSPKLVDCLSSGLRLN